MDSMNIGADPPSHRTAIAGYINSLSQGWQSSLNEIISSDALAAVERQDVSGLRDTFHIIFAQAGTATIPSRVAFRSKGFYAYQPNGRSHGEEKTPKGYQQMIVTATEHPHVVRDRRIGHSEPIIAGTGVRVRTLVEYWRAGTPPEELLQAFPHVTLAQVFDALSYYHDHQEEINEFMHTTERLTPEELRSRLHQRTPVVPDISPAQVIRERRDEP
jgi:uncharacterized protein (DUF433 family)